MSLPRPILDDMPTHIKRLILEKVDPIDRQQARSTCFWFNAISAEIPILIDTIKLHVGTHKRPKIRIITPFNITTFFQHGTKTIVRHTVGRRVHHPDTNHMELAIDRLRSMFQPNVRVAEFHLRLYYASREAPEYYDQLVDTFATRMGTGLRVWFVRAKMATRQRDYVRVLKVFEPGYLRAFTLESSGEMAVDELVATEQWKQAMVVGVPSIMGDFKFEDYAHLNSVFLTVKEFGVEDVKRFHEIAFNKTSYAIHIDVRTINLRSFIAEFGPFHLDENNEWVFRHNGLLIQIGVNRDLSCCIKSADCATLERWKR